MPSPKRYVVTVGKGPPTAVELSFDGTGEWTAEADGQQMAVRLESVDPDGLVRVTVDGHPMTLRMVTGPDGDVRLEQVRRDRTDTVPVRVRSEGEVILGAAAASPQVEPPTDPVLRAPITGVILSVDVAEGDQVSEGQPLLVLEAMKMETVLRAPFTGTVSKVHVAAGDTVRTAEVLAELHVDAG